MRYAIRYTVERQTEIEDDTIAGAESRARNMAFIGKWTLLSVSRADDPKPMPGEGVYGIPVFELIT